MEKTTRWSALGGLVALLLAVSPAFAAGVDGGVTFHDIAQGGGAGITFARTPSVTLAIRLALQAQPAITFADFNTATVNSPQKDHGDPGVAIFDYDNDGYLDIYVTNGPGTPNSLYHNLLGKTGVLQFEDVGVAAGVGATAQDSTGVCVGDIDNDGWDDLYVVGVNGSHNILFHNNGNGTFSDITATAGDIAGVGRNASSCTMGDVNGDGLLDIYVGNTYADWGQRALILGSEFYDSRIQHNQLFINHSVVGQGSKHGPSDAAAQITFVDESAARGVQSYEGLAGDPTYTWGVAAVDYDGDGDVDLLEADTQGGMSRPNVGLNRILENDGTGHFTDVTFERGLSGAAKQGSWMGLSFGDYNCDGYLDFFSTNLGAFLGGPGNESRWFYGSASKAFSDPGITPLSAGGIGGSVFGWGTASFDYDNDGDTDTVWYGDDDLVQFIAADNKGTLMRNTGACTSNFQWDSAALDRDNRRRQVQGVAVGDLNNDGFVDIVNAATYQFTPVTTPINRFLLYTQVFGPIFNTVFDSIARIELVYHLVDPTHLGFIPTSIVNGDLSVEINSANNGNHWAKIDVIGTRHVGVGRNNRDGIGALVRFTPDGGKTSIRPVTGGDSHASTSARQVTVGLGDATRGTVEVDWPGPNGPVRNKLYDVAAGERVLVPEIPCSYDVQGQSRNDFAKCVKTALQALRHPGVDLISNPDGYQRFESNMLRAYDESPH